MFWTFPLRVNASIQLWLYSSLLYLSVSQTTVNPCGKKKMMRPNNNPLQYSNSDDDDEFAPNPFRSGASVTSISGNTSTGALAISIARRNSSALAGWIFRRSRVVFSFGYAIWCDAKGVRSSCRKRTGVSTRIFCASFLEKMTRPDRRSPSNTRGPTAGYPPTMTD